MVFLYLRPLLLLSPLLVSSISATSAGCGKDLPAGQYPPGGESHHVDFNQSDGTARTYLIHIPVNYDKNTPVPLIFSFHGGGKNSSEQEGLSEFSNESLNPNGIAVYPQGLKNQWQGNPDAKSGVDDIGFVSDMISHFSDRYCIDTSRVYAAGKSVGGGLTGLLACDSKLSTQIAAFAPVSGEFYINGSSSSDCDPEKIAIPCSPGRNPVPILEFHGLVDKTAPYAGGGRRGECVPSIPHWVREWSKREGYGLSNTTTQLYGGHVQKYEYGGAAGQLGIITHYLDDTLAHAWPSTTPNDDNRNGTYYNATPIIMDFFNKYTL